MEKEEKVTIRLTEALRRALQREADEAGIKLSEHIRRLLLVTHPHIAAFDDVARIEASARKAGAKASEGVPYLMSVLRRLEEGLQALQGLEALTTQWREAAARELQVAIADVNEHIWGPVEQDEQTLPEHPLGHCLRMRDPIEAVEYQRLSSRLAAMEKGLERKGDVHAISRERTENRVD